MAGSVAADLGDLLVVGLFRSGGLALGSASSIKLVRSTLNRCLLVLPLVVSFLAPSLFLRSCGKFVDGASWVGPVGVTVSPGFVGSRFGYVLAATLLGNWVVLGHNTRTQGTWINATFFVWHRYTMVF